MSWRLCQRETVCQAFCDHQPGEQRRCRDRLRSHLGSDQTGSRGQSPPSEEWRRVIITARLLQCREAQAHSSRGSRKGRGFYPQVIMFSTDCFLVLEKLNIVFHNDFAATLNNETTRPMRRLHWAEWTNQRTLSSLNSFICPKSILRPSPLLSQGTKQAYQVCLFPYKTRLHYYYCYCVSQTGAKSDPWPLSVHLVHDTTLPGTQFAGKSAQLLRKIKSENEKKVVFDKIKWLWWKGK